MKILSVNYRHFVSGGPERYLFNVSSELIQRGHTVMPFSIHYTNNIATPYAKYFVEPLGSRDEIYFDDQQMSPRTFINTLKRLFYAKDVEDAVSRMIQETKPDIAYVLHFLRKLSPAVLVGIKRHHIPIIVRLSDYGMLCPQAHCLRDDTVCTLCIEGNILPSVRHKCVRGSFPASLLNASATLYHRRRRYSDLIDAFVVTNQLMYDMMLRAGYPHSKLALIPTFTDPTTFSPSKDFIKSDYFMYCGRLEDIKGVHILIEACAHLKRNHPEYPMQLKITGAGSDRYTSRLKDMTSTLGLANNVQFLGQVDSLQLAALLSQAAFSVIPSLWYENLPNALLESYACGTPVLASDIGCLPACVQDGVNGFVFRTGDPLDLAQKMELMISHPTLAHAMAQNARKEALSQYAPDQHLDRLLALFESHKG